MTDTSNSRSNEDTEEYLRLRYKASAIEAFNLFIKRNVPEDLHAHFADSDDNEAEFVRRAIDRDRLLHGEMLIGEDEKILDWANPARTLGRNEIRAEQRERNV